MSSRINQWSLIGIPDHTGVIHVGGRIGASLGPRAFRQVFSKMKGLSKVQETCTDLGDVAPLGADIVQNHRQASDQVKKASGLTVVVGGGHDHGFSHLRGVAEAHPGKRIGCINIDAHLDVRKAEPVITSGSPFYLALESGVVRPEDFIEFGIQSHCNAKELWAYIDSKKIQVIPFAKVRGWKAQTEFKAALNRLAGQCDYIVVSLDLDAVSFAYAPGVSAPQAEGFSANDIIEMMEEAGRQEKVTSLGIFELCPPHDIDDHTARLGISSNLNWPIESEPRQLSAALFKIAHELGLAQNSLRSLLDFFAHFLSLSANIFERVVRLIAANYGVFKPSFDMDETFGSQDRNFEQFSYKAFSFLIAR
jgi:formiminoglutamase